MSPGRCGCGECVYEWYTWFRCLPSTCDVLVMSVVRGVGGVCDMCMCLLGALWVERGVSG